MTTQPADDYMMDEWVRPGDFAEEVTWRWIAWRQAGRRKSHYDTFTLVHPRTHRVPRLLLCEALLWLSCISSECSSFCFPKRKWKDKDDVVRARDRKETNRATAQNRNYVKGWSWSLVPTGSYKESRARVSASSQNCPGFCSPPAPRKWPHTWKRVDSGQLTTPPGGRGMWQDWPQEQAWKDV